MDLPKKRDCLIKIKGIIPYQEAWEEQKKLVSQRVENPEKEDILLLLEHPPVYTLGTGADEGYIKFDRTRGDREVYRIDRGGEVTYHCPGQLVGYPILNLHYYGRDLHLYLRQLEEVIIRAIATYDLKGERIAGLTGVWLNGYKIAAIGIKASRWIAYHGFALNINPDLSGFNDIIPCGIGDRPVGSLEMFVPGIDFDRTRQRVIEAFAEVMKVNPIRVT